MLSGQADFCHWNPLQAIETLKKAPNLAVYEPTADFAMYYWGLKSTRENLQDKRVRKALAHLVDREEINKAIFFGQAETARSLVHPNALDFEPATLDVLTKRDPELSKKLLDEAGWKMGDDGFRYKDGKKLELLMYSYTVGQIPSCRKCCRQPRVPSASTSRSRPGIPRCSSRRSRSRTTTSGRSRCPTPRPATRCISTTTPRTGRCRTA
jgi:hypothetical protein